MITGAVNSNLEAIVRLLVNGIDGNSVEIEAAVDTGFTGSLTLPTDMVSSLGLPWLGREQGILGDGRLGLFDIYAATVAWNENDRIVDTVAAGAQPLIGMGLVHGHELSIQAVEGGAVRIEALA